MAKITIGLGFLLILIGVIGYLATGRESVTALIPAFLGLPILVLGVVAQNEGRRKHAMHGAVLLALLGFLGTLRGLAKAPALLSGATVERPNAVVAQALTAVLCAAFIALAINSFVKARKGNS